ncbi:MAG: motility protein A [bacterium]
MKLDLATVIGLVVAWGSIFIALLIESGGNILVVFRFVQGAAFFIVVGGTVGATMICYPMETIMNIFAITKNAFVQRTMNPQEVINTLVGFATKARREGLLGLEDEINKVDDKFLKKGIQLVVDGTDIELVRNILETDLSFLETRHKMGEGVFMTLGGFSPTLGIVGTVMGLVNALAEIESAAKTAMSISVAFIATFYGIAFANIIFLPIAFKLKAKTAEEVLIKEVMIEGILSISAGDNPRIVEEKLKAFLSPKDQAVAKKEGTEGGGAA